MSAVRIASDDFAIDTHLDSAGHRFGATAQRPKAACGNAVCAPEKSVETMRANEDEGPEVLYRALI